MYQFVEAITKDFAPKGGKPGYIIRKADGSTQWIEADVSKMSPEERGKIDKDFKSYERRRGPEQLQRDVETRRAEKAKQDAARSAKPQPSPAATPPAAPAGQPPSGSPPSASTPSATPPAAPAVAKSSPASLSTAEKIKQGMEVYTQQKSAGDFKAADKTGLEVWKLANPKLAAAQAERERIRGTAQTDNPLIDDDMRARMPKNTPSIQSPTLQKDLKNLAPNYSRLVNNPNAFRGAEPSAQKPTPSTLPAPSPTTTTTAFARTTPALAKPSPAVQSAGQQYGARRLSSSGGTSAFRPGTVAAASNLNAPTPVARTNKIASSTTQPTVAPIRQMQTQSYQYDAYDLVLEYLISTGHAETIEEASYIMLEMSPSEIQTVVNSYEYSGENVNEIAPLVAGLAGAGLVAGLGKLAYDRFYQGKQKAQQTPTARPAPSGPNLHRIGYNFEKRRKELERIENMQ